MTKKKKTQVGELPPRYNFIMNPYPEIRLSSCPFCGEKTGQRKIPLLIYIEPRHSVALNYTCRYCKVCDLLIAHKHDVENILTNMFRQLDPDAIGNNYLIWGTLEKASWRKGLRQNLSPEEHLSYASDFLKHYNELRMTRPGLYSAGAEPPIMEPPPSMEWTKNKTVRVGTKPDSRAYC
jgi:hypothetical protein